MYYVAENGALVVKGRQVLHVESLSDQEVQKMFKIASSYSYPVVVAGLASAYIREQDDTKYYNEMKKYFEKLTVVKSLSEIKDKIFKISLTVPVDVMPELLAKLVKKYPELTIVSGAADSIDMQQKGMNKAKGLEYLAQRLGIKPNEMIAFGDSGNDVGMLEYVGHSYVTRYALPEAKRASDQIIGSNNESAVQKEILKLLQN